MEDKVKILENLLEKVSSLNKIESLTKKNATDDFNIFRICGVNHYENTHSAILAELLKVTNSDNLNEFLEAFVEALKNKMIDETFIFSITNARVHTEYDTKEGRIDILIENGRQGIIIENKVYAKDQFEQLKRYEKFAKNKYKDEYQILYLTLFGEDASEQSGEGVKYKNISYQDNIVNWLEKCVQISARKPTVRETIIQYINHIKNLTTNNQIMNEDLMKLLSKEENLDAVFTIGNNLGNIKNEIVNKTFLPQLSQICDELGLVNTSTEHDRVSTSWAGFSIDNPNWNYFNIFFEFSNKNLNSLIIGICHKKPDLRNDETYNILKSMFKKSNNNASFDEFPYRNWGKEAMIDILNGKMVENFKIEIEKIIDKTKNLEM